MRIAILQDHLRNGGTERQTLAISEGLATLGVDVRLIIFRRGGVLDQEANKLPITLHFLKQGFLKTDWFAPGLTRLLAKVSPDAVLPMGRMANCHAGLLSRNSRRYTLLATFRTGKQIPSLYKKALREADHIVANSNEALGRIAAEYGIHRSDTASVIYNGCIRDFDSIAISRTQENRETQEIRFCSVSMFRPEKQQIRLIRICAQLPDSLDWQLTLAGDGPTLATCQSEAEKLGIAERVHFPGMLKDPTEIFEKSDIALHASDRESLPNFLVEAQMSGLPVIAFDVNGVGETFLDQESGYLVKHDDEQRFLEALKSLSLDGALRARMSATAREFALRNFSPDAQAKAYLSLLEQICSR